MKKMIYMACAALFAVSCSPIDDRDSLSNTYDKNNIILSYEQASPGSNDVTLRVETKGIMGYWDYLVGKKYTDEVQIAFPYVGTHTFTFQSTTPYFEGSLANKEYPSATIEVEVTMIDTEPDAKFKDLTGSDFKGKEWVFDGVLGDNRVWWAMTESNNPGNVWWSAAGLNQGAPVDLNGKMSFDFDGGANYKYWSDASDDTTMVEGEFLLGNNFTQITLPDSESGAHLLGVEMLNNPDVVPYATSFQILEIGPDVLKLFANVQSGTGWIWQFKPAE